MRNTWEEMHIYRYGILFNGFIANGGGILNDDWFPYRGQHSLLGELNLVEY
jgi:hypothetical protein